jgi:hypothetical protein
MRRALRNSIHIDEAQKKSRPRDGGGNPGWSAADFSSEIASVRPAIDVLLDLVLVQAVLGLDLRNEVAFGLHARSFLIGDLLPFRVDVP